MIIEPVLHLRVLHPLPRRLDIIHIHYAYELAQAEWAQLANMLGLIESLKEDRGWMRARQLLD